MMEYHGIRGKMTATTTSVVVGLSLNHDGNALGHGKCMVMGGEVLLILEISDALLILKKIWTLFSS